MEVTLLTPEDQPDDANRFSVLYLDDEALQILRNAVMEAAADRQYAATNTPDERDARRHQDTADRYSKLAALL